MVCRRTFAMLLVSVVSATALFLARPAEAAPVKVYILVGQSNMQGHAKEETFDYIGEDPATAPLLREMRNRDGTARVCDDVWISYLTGSGDENAVLTGKLTVGYGARRYPDRDDRKIGPEFVFGITMGKLHDEPVVLIKTAWGGKSLFYNFRPPSAGPFQRSQQDIEKGRYEPEMCGHYYRLMIDHVKKTLADLGKVCPEYDPNQGYELGGLVWFQGWNDMVNRDVYPELPEGSEGNRYAKYSELLADFIRDVRKDLGVPKLPVVIGVMGVDGPRENDPFREAMAAPAGLPEFQGNGVAVETAPFWDTKLASIDEKFRKVAKMSYYLNKKRPGQLNADGHMSQKEIDDYLEKYKAELLTPEEEAAFRRGASNAGYHYLGCAKTLALIGQAFAEAMIELENK